MDSDQLDSDTAPAVLTEVELALILAKTIDTVKRNPDQLRHVVYDLARYKMHEQLSPAGAEHLKTSTGALEIAIQGVETFARSNKPPRNPALRREIAPPDQDAVAEFEATVLTNRPAEPRARRRRFAGPVFAPETPESRRRGWMFAGAALMGMAFAAIAIRQGPRAVIPVPAKPVSEIQETAIATPSPPAAPAPTPAEAVAAPAPLLPAKPGVYGLSGDKLTELSLLPSRPQDVRVALSPTLAPSGATPIGDGAVSFIVYRHEAQASMPESAEVRLIARVRRSMSYDAAGKLVEAPDDGWYIRNISVPYRVVLIADNPDMFRIQPDKDDTPLSPGRYGLVVKGQVYDFTIAGDVVDPRLCLERLTAANGVFVSQCATP
jgi:hypothetical protein